jgi:hypothetical protein
MQKVKKFVKEHKKEILVGVLASAVSSYIWMRKGYHLKVTKYLSLDIGLSRNPEHVGNAYLNLNKSEYTLEDFGKVGEDLLKLLPRTIDDGRKVTRIGVNYDF